VLTQPTAASGCEHNWSVYDFIHSPNRNRLHASRAEVLVYVFSNLRLMDKLIAGRKSDIPWQYVDEECEEGGASEDVDDPEASDPESGSGSDL